MPTATGRIFLVNPVKLDGPDLEGSTASVAPDTARSIPVVVVGSIAPKAGELIIVQSCGGRWVSEHGGRPESVPCNGCGAPRANLTLTVTNTAQGARMATMTFNGIDEWETACVNQIIFRLRCRKTATIFTADYFADGSCPSGQPVTCGGPGSPSGGLLLTTQSCAPFLLQYSAGSCPVLAAQGYTKFTVTA